MSELSRQEMDAYYSEIFDLVFEYLDQFEDLSDEEVRVIAQAAADAAGVALERLK
jgi:hypothetical protein